ncbi:MAG: ATPase, P-type (transporting), superfamily, subfamily, partial [Proteobacteria bacterium]|nr:ATPase, P-type (transporting), superfamily, subfamily [Pseudomonadota bacterium]
MDEANQAWHGIEAREVLAAFNVDPERGLDAAAIARGLATYGLNELPEGARRSSLLVFLQQFQSPLIYLLFIAAAFAFALGRTGDTAVILVVVFVNALIGWFQEGRAARSMEALRKLAGLRARVRRGGEELIIDTDQLLPGDIMVLAAGDGVGADARLIDGSALEAAEATLTGESLPVRKSTA